MPDGQVQTINVPALINRWGGDMFNAFVFLGPQDPSTPGLAHVAPPTPGVVDLNWRNLGYALQWFFFGGFALYMWWRMVSEDARAQALAAAPDTAHGTDPDDVDATDPGTDLDATRAVPAVPIEQGDISR